MELSTSTSKSHLLSNKITVQFSCRKFKIFFYAAKSLMIDRMPEIPFPYTHRLGVLWGMEPFRELSGKKLFECSSELMLNFSGSGKFLGVLA